MAEKKENAALDAAQKEIADLKLENENSAELIEELKSQVQDVEKEKADLADQLTKAKAKLANKKTKVAEAPEPDPAEPYKAENGKVYEFVNPKGSFILAGKRGSIDKGDASRNAEVMEALIACKSILITEKK